MLRATTPPEMGAEQKVGPAVENLPRRGKGKFPKKIPKVVCDGPILESDGDVPSVGEFAMGERAESPLGRGENTW